MSRKWFNTLSRADHMMVEKYAANMVSSRNMQSSQDISSCYCASAGFELSPLPAQVTPGIVKQELESMSTTARSIEGLDVSVSSVARQVSATYLHDDCNLGVAIVLAEAHPLHVVDVKLTSHQGVRRPKLSNLETGDIVKPC